MTEIIPPKTKDFHKFITTFVCSCFRRYLLWL